LAASVTLGLYPGFDDLLEAGAHVMIDFVGGMRISHNRLTRHHNIV